MKDKSVDNDYINTNIPIELTQSSSNLLDIVLMLPNLNCVATQNLSDSWQPFFVRTLPSGTETTMEQSRVIAGKT